MRLPTDMRAWFVAVLALILVGAFALPRAKALLDDCTECATEPAAAQPQVASPGLFDTDGFPPRWECGTWTTAHGELHILSDLAIWIAYTAIPLALFFVLRRRGDIPFPGLMMLFAGFILACGLTHLLEAVMFWWPAYRLMGVVKLATALISIVTVIVLIPLVPKLLALRSPRQLEQQVEERTRELQSQSVALREARDAAEIATRAKSDFLANMSHEIRTPLSAIIGYSELFASGDAGIVEVTQTIDRNARHLLNLLNDILDCSKIEAGMLRLESARLDLCQMFEDIELTFGSVARQKGVALVTVLANDLPEAVETDPGRVQQILVNLVGNAVKFSSKGTVRLQAGRVGDELEFRVLDEGVGMNAEQVARVFEPFEQADASVSRKHGGTGLGLTISRRLARLLAGDLVVTSSAVGQGTTMALRIPLRACAPVPAGERTQADAPPNPRLEGRRVLVVDDVAENRVLASRILAKEGAEVATADDAHVALAAVLAEDTQVTKSIDLVLTDIQMPGMDGLELARELRQRGYTGIIAAFTAGVTITDREQCLQAGCDAVIAKPVRRETLVQEVAAALAR